MKRIFKYIFSALLIFSLASPTIEAKRISPETAKQNASVLLSKSKNRKGKGVAPISNQSSLSLAETVYDSQGNPVIYIFSRGVDKGYVITSADDVLRPVLAVSDRGNYTSVDELPEIPKALIKNYIREITSLYTSNEIDNLALSASIPEEREEIDPMVELWWGQSEPFNNKCPRINGEKTVVGCVAVANAIVMAHHKYPRTGQGKVDLITGNYTINYDFGAVEFDYENMLPYYSNRIEDEETQETHDAVAELMLATAVAWGSKFGVEGTASSLSASPFSTYFCYPKDGLGMLKRDYFTIEEWEKIVYEELQAGRPVPYEGDDGSKGHAFVIDGYADGLFHINWGWFGDEDDYFSLSVLRPGSSGIGGNSDSNYSFNQGIVRGLRTPDDEPASPLFTASKFNLDSASDSFLLTSLSSKSGWQNVNVGVSLENLDSGVIDSNLEATAGSRSDFKEDDLTMTKFNIDFAGVQDGKYRVRPIIQLDGSEEKYSFDDWYPVYCRLKNTRYVDIEIRNGNIVKSEDGSDVNLNIRFTNFQSEIPIMTSTHYRGFTMDAENNGNIFLANVNKLIYYPGTDIIVPNSDGGRETVSLEPGTKKTVNMAVNNNLKVAGEYELQIVDSDNPEITYSDRIRFKMLDSNSFSTVEGLRYIIVSEEPKAVMLYGGTFDGEVTVPETVTINNSEYTVQFVGLNVASGSSKLTKLVLPNTVTSISPSSFMGCSALKEVVLPENLQYLGGNSFGSCTSLSKVNIPTSITQIYTNTFNKTALTEVEVPEGVTMIGKYAFNSAPLKHVVLPSTLKSIDAYAFYYNTIDELMVNAQEPPEISPYTFYSYNTRVYVPEGCEEKYRNHEQWKKFSSLYSIPTDTVFSVDGVWYEVTPEMEVFVTKPQDDTEYTMTSVVIPAVVTYKGFPYKVVGIADSAFMNVSSLKAVGGCGNVTVIGAHAFEGTSVSSLSIPPNTVEIGDYAYANSKAAYITHFPASLRKIGNYAFADNPDLNYRRLLDADFWFDIPATIEEIGDGAFKNCSSINTLRFNSSVTLGDKVFENTPGFNSCCLNTPDLPETFIKTLEQQIEHTGVYIDPSYRGYYSNLFDSSFKLYDILEEPTFDVEETKSLKGITKIRLYFNSTLGNPKINYSRVVLNVINTAGYVQVDDYDTYKDGYVDLVVTPTLAGGNMDINLTFEQPGLFLTIPIVVDTPAVVISTIDIEKNINLNVGDTHQITCTFTPENPSDKTLIWESSDPNVATVDGNGLVTAISNGKATITCKALRGPASATCLVEVGVVLRPGKALDEDDPNAPITVADVVAIANHIMGDTHEKFNETNADANGDGNITVSDITTTVGIIMNQGNSIIGVEDEAQEISEYILLLNTEVDDYSENFLNFSEIRFENSESASSFATLETMDCLTALQADIVCPSSIEISNIQLGNLSSHILSWRKLDNGNYRVVIYSLTSDLLPVSPAPILNLTLKKTGDGSGMLSLMNAWASSPEAEKTSLYASGGSVEIPTGIGYLYSDFSEPYADVFSVDGTLIRRNMEVIKLKAELAPGIYILRCLNSTAKVLIP